MKSIIIGALLIIPVIGFSQFKQSEFYMVGRFSFGMGMNSYTYSSELEGTATKVPSTLQIELGSGKIPEVGVGFKIDKNIYVETSISFAKTSDFYSTKSGNSTTEQGYSFNRYAIQLNGKYFVPINEKFTMDFNGGLSVTIPQDLIVKMSGFTETIRYAGSNGVQGGFSGNYIVGPVTGAMGIRYRLERFTMKEKQNLPDNFENINPNFQKISSSGIDVVFSVLYNF